MLWGKNNVVFPWALKYFKVHVQGRRGLRRWGGGQGLVSHVADRRSPTPPAGTPSAARCGTETAAPVAVGVEKAARERVRERPWPCTEPALRCQRGANESVSALGPCCCVRHTRPLLLQQRLGDSLAADSNSRTRPPPPPRAHARTHTRTRAHTRAGRGGGGGRGPRPALTAVPPAALQHVPAGRRGRRRVRRPGPAALVPLLPLRVLAAVPGPAERGGRGLAARHQWEQQRQQQQPGVVQ